MNQFGRNSGNGGASSPSWRDHLRIKVSTAVYGAIGAAVIATPSYFAGAIKGQADGYVRGIVVAEMTGIGELSEQNAESLRKLDLQVTGTRDQIFNLQRKLDDQAKEQDEDIKRILELLIQQNRAINRIAE